MVLFQNKIFKHNVNAYVFAIKKFVRPMIERNFCVKVINDDNDKNFSAKYCLNLVQNHDHENFLCTLLMRGDRRRYAFSLRAFNVELSKIGSTVSEDAIAKIKLKFWHESIDKCFEKQSTYVAEHPVLKELKNTVINNKITKSYLKRLVIARDRPGSKGFLTIKEIEDYAEQSYSSLYYILLEIYGIKKVNADHAVSHLGKAQGISNLLRSIPYRGRSEAVNIPHEILIKHGVTQERIMRDKLNDNGVEDCVFEMATLAHQHLKKARILSDHVPAHVREICLPAIAIERFLERLRKAKFRLSDQNLIKRDQMLPIAYFWNRLKSKY